MNRWMPLAAATLMALAAVWHFGTNMPFWDEWTHAEFLLKWHDGQLGWSDLWAQYNESRKVIPRLVMIGLAKVTGHDLRWQMSLSVALLAATTATLINRKGQGHSAVALTLVALLFHPMQIENWLWGVQFICFIPLLCLVVGMRVLTPSVQGNRAVAVSSLTALAVAGSLSYASGLLLWPIFCIGLVLNRDWRLLKPLGLAAALFFGLYFYGYQRPSLMPGWSAALGHPLQLADFMLVQIGLPWGLGAAYLSPDWTLNFCRTAGCVVLVAVGVGFYRSRHTSSRPALMLILYSAGCIALTALGRSSLGIQAALPGRYVTFALPISVGAMLLLLPTTRHIRLWAGLVAAAVLACVPAAFDRASSIRTLQRQGQADLMLADCYAAPGLGWKVADHYPILRETALRLSNAGYLHPKMIDRDTLRSHVETEIPTGWIRLEHAPGTNDSQQVVLTLRPSQPPPDVVIGIKGNAVVCIAESPMADGLVSGNPAGVTEWLMVRAGSDRLLPLRWQETAAP